MIIYAAIAAAAEERRRGLPPVVTPDEYLELDRCASQRQENVGGVAYRVPGYSEVRPTGAGGRT